MKKTLLTLALAFVALSLAAQQEPNYELAAQFSAKRVNNMVFSTSVTPNWFQNSDKFWYEWKTSKGTEYYIVDPIAKTKRNLFNMERLAMQIT
ncbi:MAG: S9 family peptidase, partial [Bacteroidales bacterium]|nr:S9 family peptidase [Bacteroidales bacterium]